MVIVISSASQPRPTTTDQQNIMKSLMFTDGEPDDNLARHLLKKQGITPDKVVMCKGAKDVLLQKAQKWTETFGDETYVDFDPSTLAGVTELIVLCPPTHLIDHMKTQRQLYANITMWYYGSFNTRCMFDKYEKSDIIEFFNCFKRCYIYERFLATPGKGKGNLNADSTPEGFMDKVFNLKGMAQVMVDWDTAIVQKALRSCMKLLGWEEEDAIDILPPELDASRSLEERQSYQRKYAKIMSIEKNGVGQQMVLADPGIVVTTPKDYTASDISFNGDYTVATPNEKSTVYIVNELGHDVVVGRIDALIV